MPSFACQAPLPKQSEKRRLVCWDLDGTLGSFKAVTAKAKGLEYNFLRKGLRHGVEKALLELSNEGLTNVLTTYNSGTYASDCLAAAGLTAQLSKVYANELIAPSKVELRKDYSVVCRDFNIDMGDFRSNVLVVGDDLLLDRPENGVLIWEPEALTYSATVTASVVKLLLNRGNGDFSFGFDNLCSQGKGARAYPHLLGRSDLSSFDFEGINLLLFIRETSRVLTIYEIPGDKITPLELLPNI